MNRNDFISHANVVSWKSVNIELPPKEDIYDVIIHRDGEYIMTEGRYLPDDGCKTEKEIEKGSSWAGGWGMYSWEVAQWKYRKK